MNYQLSLPSTNEIKFPIHIKDVAAATVHLFDNYKLHNIDPSSIFIGGHSAGGNMSSLLLRNENLRGYTDEQRKSQVWENIKGVIGISGIYDFNRFLKDFPSYKEGFFDAFINAKDFIEASPCLINIEKINMTPFLLIHSKDHGDELVNSIQAEIFYEYLLRITPEEKRNRIIQLRMDIRGSHYEILENEELILAIKEFTKEFK